MPDQFMEDYKRDNTVEGLVQENKRLREALFKIQCEQLDRATDVGRSAHSLRKMAMATRDRIIAILCGDQ